ncbi:MAG: hypothetical protein DMF88_25260 [Acidobacteria bacterium]|nr:MAG: hypothetical protein DMF88_25260 [Acidobacteriota bacterium]
MNHRTIVVRARKLGRRAGAIVRRPAVRAMRGVARQWRRLTRPALRALRPLFAMLTRARRVALTRARRVALKRTARIVSHVLSYVRKYGSRARRLAWRYTLHYPPRWIDRYVWQAVGTVRHRIVYALYQWNGAMSLALMRGWMALTRPVRPRRSLRLPALRSGPSRWLGALRWQGSLILMPLLRLPLPRLSRTSKRPPLYQEARGIHLKERGQSYEQSFQGSWGKLRYQQALELGKQKKMLMWEAYNSVSRTVMLNVPYVYVALHFQPERTTSSLGGPFADQYLVVDMIARCVPDGWKVYVKEHPSQFYPPFCGERSRHADLYMDLQKLPNVELVSLATSSFQLIDNARAVATVTGTVGWEAIVRGVPALVFGSPWYRACEGVWLVPTEQALRDALRWIEAGVRPDYRKVRLFIHALELVCARAGLGYGTPDEAELGLTHEETVDRLTALLHRHWTYMQRTPPAPARASLDGAESQGAFEIGI